MLKKIFFLIALVLLLPGFRLSARAGDGLPVPKGARCVECGMVCSVEGPFTARRDGEDGKRMFFCDIGDMMTWFNAKEDDPETYRVRDYTTRQWISARDAYYVRDKRFKTPMGWAIAAFRDSGDAAASGKARSFEEMRKALP